MKWIAAAGVALACLLGMSGAAIGATLSQVVPADYLKSDPSYVAAPQNDPRLFISERGSHKSPGQIRLVKAGTPLTAPFLTIPEVDSQIERGLLSFAFAPDYPSSGLFYVFYTAKGPDALDPDGKPGDLRVVEYRVSGDPDRADAGSARLVIAIPHQWSHHNGGWIGFGPDGKLYISTGDNGDGNNSQSLDNLLGKILRIGPADPPGAATYSIPTDNPFVATSGARDEIYAYGLRNPFRASFTPDGRLSVADVGEKDWEEINLGDLKGKNLGWPACEGFCSPPNAAYTDPFYAYDSTPLTECAVIGGHVVTDPGLTDLTGRYIYADLCGGVIRSLDPDVPGGDPRTTDLNTHGNVVSFGQDGLGCSYVMTYKELFRLVGEESGEASCPIPPDPPADVTYRSFIPKRAVIRNFLEVGAKCSISCSVKATATFRITRNRFRRKPVRFRPAPARAKIGPSQRHQLQIQVPPRRVRVMRKAVRQGSRVTAVVKVKMTGADGSSGSGQSVVRLVGPKKKKR